MSANSQKRTFGEGWRLAPTTWDRCRPADCFQRVRFSYRRRIETPERLRSFAFQPSKGFKNYPYPTPHQPPDADRCPLLLTPGFRDGRGFLYIQGLAGSGPVPERQAPTPTPPSPPFPICPLPPYQRGLLNLLISSLVLPKPANFRKPIWHNSNFP